MEVLISAVLTVIVLALAGMLEARAGKKRSRVREHRYVSKHQNATQLSTTSD
jgi:Tfp pilus assembly protein PilV